MYVAKAKPVRCALLPGNSQILFATTQRQEFIGARHTIGSDCWLFGLVLVGLVECVSAFANGTGVMMC